MESVVLRAGGVFKVVSVLNRVRVSNPQRHPYIACPNMGQVPPGGEGGECQATVIHLTIRL